MKVFSSIYIGSYEISMKVFEIRKSDGIKEIDNLKMQTDVIREVLSVGKISSDTTDKLCRILNDLKNIMLSYKVDEYSVFASSIFNDASNGIFVLEQIHVRTTMKVQVISNSQQRFLGYEAVASLSNFDDIISDSAILVDIGGVSLQITLFCKGKIVTTQHISLGMISVNDSLNKLSGMSQAIEQTYEMMNKEINVFKTMFLQDIEPKYMIILGDYLSSILDFNSELDNKRLKAEDYLKCLSKYNKEVIKQASFFNIDFEDNEVLAEPLVMLHKSITEVIEPKYVISPGYSICEGMAYDYCYSHDYLTSLHDFNEDIISAAWSIAKRYGSYQPHLKALVKLSTSIFDVMNKHHQLSSRERLLMEVIAILHDCGKYISIGGASDCSYAIIMATEILGLSHKEREIIATTVEYNRKQLEGYESFSDKFSIDEYMVIIKLLSILKVANALDRSHKQKLKNCDMVVKNSKLFIYIEANASFSLEKGLFSKNAKLFEEVFSIKPILKERKNGD